MPGILWNPQQAMRTPDGGGQSAANGFWHEIGHLFDFLNGVLAVNNMMPFEPTPAYVESEFARAYGEGLRSGENEGEFYQTRAGVTSFWGQ